MKTISQLRRYIKKELDNVFPTETFIKKSIKWELIYRPEGKERFKKYTEAIGEGFYKLIINDELVARFTLMKMPGCNGVIISKSSFILEEFRGLGLGTVLHFIRIEIAKFLRYQVMLMTVVINNTPQIRIIQKSKCIEAHRFLNIKTGNTVGVFLLPLIEDKNDSILEKIFALGLGGK